MIPVIISLVVVAVIVTLFFVSKKKQVVIPPPPPISSTPEPVYYSFEVRKSDTLNEDYQSLEKFTVHCLNYEFCLNTEFINWDGVFSNYTIDVPFYLHYDNVKVQVRRSGENAVAKVSDCID